MLLILNERKKNKQYIIWLTASKAFFHFPSLVLYETKSKNWSNRVFSWEIFFYVLLRGYNKIYIAVIPRVKDLNTLLKPVSNRPATTDDNFNQVVPNDLKIRMIQYGTRIRAYAILNQLS